MFKQPMDLVTFVLGFLLAYVIGLTGVGGGALVAPALFIILDLPYTEAIGTSLAYALLTKFISATQHIRQGTVHRKLILLFALWGIPGSITGSYFLHTLGTDWEYIFPIIMGCLLLAVAGLLGGEASGLSKFHRSVPMVPENMSFPASLGIGIYSLVVGALMGVTSVGSGSLIILLMVYLFSLPARIIVGSNILIALIMVLPAAATHLGLGGVSLRVLGFLLLGSLPGAYLGSRSTLWISDRMLRYAIALFISISAVATFVKIWLG